MAALRIVNHCFASYFQLNTINLSKNLIKTIEAPDKPAISVYPISQQVSYYYYVGRISVFGGEYKRAQNVLRNGFAMCKKSSVGNKRLFLLYLVPVEILLGRMPSERLLEKYSLTMLKDIVSAVRTGNLKKFRESLDRHGDTFISLGLFMIMEKLRTICWRNFFKRVALIVQEKSKNKLLLEVHVLPLARWLGEEDIDIDEIECITANLIFSGYIKGYISHKHRCVVLSNKQPFPLINTVRNL
eukprot:TRINITY_DN5266_c0_g1_i2.p1 TRINITY_DN5266_c0_g1~~TRINITY_DN5266_c0_g1_i2.p1  ORF type:complete len:243 (-),score=40.11 TRINITY_DN5266_c0_g1_i2:35-763(-)